MLLSQRHLVCKLLLLIDHMLLCFIAVRIHARPVAELWFSFILAPKR